MDLSFLEVWRPRMDFNTYLKRKTLIGNFSEERPKYVRKRLYSLFRPVVDNDVREVDDPETRGLTVDEYPVEGSTGIKGYLVRKKLIDNLADARPKYVRKRLYSLFRPVVDNDVREVDDPETRGLTVDEYPVEGSTGIKGYLVRKKLIDNLADARPKYVLHKLFSLYRPVVDHCPAEDDPYTRGLTLNEYPFAVTVEEGSEDPGYFVQNNGNWVRFSGIFVVNTPA
jgi:hypothetical protein